MNDHKRIFEERDIRSMKNNHRMFRRRYSERIWQIIEKYPKEQIQNKMKNQKNRF